MPDIIDNRKEKLSDHLNIIMQSSESARLAVGYFFLSGFNTVAKTLSNLKEVKLLIGNTSNRETIEQIAEGYRRLEMVEEAIEEDLYLKKSTKKERIIKTSKDIQTNIEFMDQTDENENLVRLLIKLIEDKKLKVRIYTKGRLHAKAYIFNYGKVYDSKGNLVERQEDGIGLVGSSNLSLSGLHNNSELNVLVHGNDNVKDLINWFDTLWIESESFDEILMNNLKTSWASHLSSPYDIYMKTIYKLVKDRLEDEEGTEILWDDDIIKQLADFQKVAVKQAIHIIRFFGGCFISDVVGLGKSFIGTAIIKHFERTEHVRPLIICPAALTEMWERYNEVYNLHARVLSMGFLKENSDNSGNLLIDDVKYRDRDFLLVDESHNFRNNTTQRYKLLEQFLSFGSIKCCFLTATPRNKTVWDIYHQIKLFHQEEQTELPIDPPIFKEYFKLIDSGERKLPYMLANILIRRTRKHILRFYGYDSKTDKPIDSFAFNEYLNGNRRAYVLVAGRHQYFPKRLLNTIQYSIENTYQGLYHQIRKYLGQTNNYKNPKFIYRLCYARYGLWHYVKKEKQNVKPYSELQRAGINIRGLVRILLFKRLESSIYAFRESVKRMHFIHVKFLAAMEKGYIPAGEDVHKILYYEDNLNTFLKKILKEDKKYHINDFDVSLLEKHIKHDMKILEEIIELVSPIKPEHDDKLQVLNKLLKKNEVKSGKKIIFTQFADTAKYLYENLNPDEKDDTIDVIYSSDKSRERVIGRFAPIANPEYIFKHGETEINTLISTDVFSEGLNLQDCDKIINYDLHWNPVRLIQRFGRIDRIGTEYDTIYGYNFLPESGIDKNLGLKDMLSQRIQEIHDTIGEDSAILDQSERLNEEAMYAVYERKGDQLSLFDEGDEEFIDINEAEEILRQLKKEEPEEFERIKNIPDGIRARRLTDIKNYYVFCEAAYPIESNLKNYQQLYLLDEKLKLLSRDISFVLSKIKADRYELSGDILPEKYNQSVMLVKKEFAKEVIRRESERKYSYALTLGQRYIIRELRVLNSQTDDEDTKVKITLFESSFRGPITSAIKNELNRLRLNIITGEDLITSLSYLYTQHNMSMWLKTRKKSYEKPEVKIVCSEYI